MPPNNAINTDSDDRYHLALGRFIDAFATAEHNLKFALGSVANVPRDTAQAIFSGVRVKQAIDFINRIFESRKTPIPLDLRNALGHMSAILSARDDIVHYGASVDGNEFITTNSPHTIPRQARTKRRDIEDLDAMTEDLLTIGHLLIWMMAKDNPNAFPEALELLDNAAHAPLRYRPQ